MEAEVLEEEAPSSRAGVSGFGTKLFLGGLSWETTEEKLREHFAKYGEIAEVIVMRDRMTSKPRGFGFINFKDEASARSACQEIDAKPSVPQGEGQRPRSKKIFVGGLAPDTTEDQFKSYFELFGKVTEVQIMVDHTSGRSRGFGFITFEEESSVDKVFAAGSMHELHGKKVEVKNATPKGSGPQGGRGAGRGLIPTGRGFIGGRGFGEFSQLPGSYGVGQSYQLPPGYGIIGGAYGYGMAPFGAYTGMMMGQLGGYPGYAYGPYAAPGGFPSTSGGVAGFVTPQQQQPQPQPQPQQQQQQQLPYQPAIATEPSGSGSSRMPPSFSGARRPPQQ